MKNDQEILRKFLDIFNEYKSQKTGWPKHRIVKTRNGKTRRWRMSRDKLDAWLYKNFIKTGLMKKNYHEWEWAGADWDKRVHVSLDDKQRSSYEEYFKGFYKSDGITYAVQKEFAIKVIALGYVSK